MFVSVFERIVSWLFSSPLEEKLNCTSFDSVRSACCDAKHVDQQGNQLLCDREAGGGQLDVGRLLVKFCYSTCWMFIFVP